MNSRDPDDAQQRDGRGLNEVGASELGRTGWRGTVYRAKAWVLIDVHRWTLIAALTTLVFATTVIVGVYGPVSAAGFLVEPSIARAYIELQTAVVAVVTVALAINQLVLSPELGPLSTERQRLDDVLNQQHEVEESTGIARSPTAPAEYLRTMADDVAENAERLAAAAEATDDPDAREETREYADRLDHVSSAMARRLDGQRFGTVPALAAARMLDASWAIGTLRGLRNEHGERLTEQSLEASGELLDALERYTVARNYLETVYVRLEFVNFSHSLLYTVLPALLVSHYAVGTIEPGALPGSTLGVQNLLWYEAATFSISILPVTVLVSYVARLTTIAKVTALVSPFSIGG